jgi:hypothetical protein
MLEFFCGSQLQIGHPEAIRHEGQLYMMRRPDGGFIVFSAESVSRLLDLPINSRA